MDAVRHLFEVAAGLDSQMIGENQILAQVKAAYTESLETRMSRLVFHRLFHNAFRVGKAVRTRTHINCGAVSIGSGGGGTGPGEDRSGRGPGPDRRGRGECRAGRAITCPSPVYAGLVDRQSRRREGAGHGPPVRAGRGHRSFRDRLAKLSEVDVADQLDRRSGAHSHARRVEVVAGRPDSAAADRRHRGPPRHRSGDRAARLRPPVQHRRPRRADRRQSRPNAAMRFPKRRSSSRNSSPCSRSGTSRSIWCRSFRG